MISHFVKISDRLKLFHGKDTKNDWASGLCGVIPKIRYKNMGSSASKKCRNFGILESLDMKR